MNLKHQISIRRQFLIAFMLLAIVPLLFLGVVISSQSIIFQKSQVQDWMDQLTAQAATTISFYLDEQEHKLELLLKSNYLPGMTIEEQVATLSKFLSASKDDAHGYIFNDITLLDEDGIELCKISRSDMRRVGSRADWSGSPEFIEVLQSKEHTHSTVYYDKKEGAPLTKIYHPLIDLYTSEVKGVLVVEMQLIFIRNVISNIKVGKFGVSFLVDHEGRVLSHPNTSEILKGAIFLPPDKPMVQKGLHNDSALVAAQPIYFGVEPFYLVAELTTAEAFSHIPGFLIIIAITLVIAVVGAIGLGFLLVRHIVGPVESLSKTVRQITNGDFSLRAEVVNRNEIGGLAEDFNIMTDKLLHTLKAYENEKNMVKKAINSLCHPFFVVDVATYQIILANTAAKFGDLSSKSKCHQLTHHSDTPCSSQDHPCPIREIKVTKAPVVVEHVHYDEDGKPGIFEVHGYPIFDKDGEVIQVIEYVIDVTEKKRIEQNLWKARETGMAEVAGEVMHNIGNAITPAKIAGLNIWRRLEDNSIPNALTSSFAEFYSAIESNPSIPEEEKTRFRKIANLLPKTARGEFDYFLAEMIKICNKHEHIEHIINLQHKYAQKRGSVVEVYVNDMVGDALQILNDALSEKAITIVTELKDIPSIKTERPKLLEVMISLIKNGLESTLVNSVGNRKLILSTGVEDGDGSFVYFSVKDNGAGFTESEKGKLFSFGFLNTEAGDGLELHAIANYVNLMKGSIEAYSDGPGKGATFITHLPVTPD